MAALAASSAQALGDCLVVLVQAAVGLLLALVDLEPPELAVLA